MKPDLIPDNITTVPGVGWQCGRCGCRLEKMPHGSIEWLCALLTLARRKHAICKEAIL